MIFDPFDASQTEARAAARGRRDEVSYTLNRDLDRHTVRELFRNETNVRRVA